MFPERFNFKHYRGDRFSKSINFKLNGVAEDLTGATILAQVRADEDIASPKLFDFRLSRIDAQGSVEFWLSPADTSSLDAGSYVYDIQINDTTRLYGKFELIGDVSR